MNKFETIIIGIRIASSILKIPEPETYLISSRLLKNKNITSLFKKERYEILFNKEWVIRSELPEILIACFHEVRHAYQSYSIKYSINELEDVLKKWNEDFETYNKPNIKKDSNSDFSYLNQSIEIDAIAFSYWIMKKEFNIITFIPEIIKEKVLDYKKKFYHEK